MGDGGAHCGKGSEQSRGRQVRVCAHICGERADALRRGAVGEALPEWQAGGRGRSQPVLYYDYAVLIWLRARALR